MQAGRRFHAVTAHALPVAQGGEVMMRYAPRHPRTARRLAAFMGFTVDGSTQDYRRVGESIPFVQLVESAGPGR